MAKALDIVVAKPAARPPARPTFQLRTFITGVAVGCLSIIVVAASALAIWQWQHHKPVDSQDVAAIQKDVARHFALPAEEPVLATVTDTNKLTSPFLKRAQNGDRVLIYQQTKLAIIYRPSIDRIIAVGPVSIDTPSVKN